MYIENTKTEEIREVDKILESKFIKRCVKLFLFPQKNIAKSEIVLDKIEIFHFVFSRSIFMNVFDI